MRRDFRPLVSFCVAALVLAPAVGAKKQPEDLASLLKQVGAVQIELQSAEEIRDAKALLERLQRQPGKIAWVAIAEDCADPNDIAQQIRDAHPTVGIVLLGAGETSAKMILEILQKVS